MLLQHFFHRGLVYCCIATDRDRETAAYRTVDSTATEPTLVYMHLPFTQHSALTMATPESRKNCRAWSWMASADRLIADRSLSWDRKGKLATFKKREKVACERDGAPVSRSRRSGGNELSPV